MNTVPPGTNNSERDDIEWLLPWYVTGRLDAADTRRVSQYIERHPEMMELVELTRAESEVVAKANEALGYPSDRALDRLLASAGGARSENSVRFMPGILEKLTDWIAGLSPQQLGLAAAAAMLLILVQGISIGSLVMTREGAQYETAAGPEPGPVQVGTFALVAFVPGASAAGITALLTETGAVIVEGPKAGGLFRIRLSPKNLSDSEARTALVKLTGNASIVAFGSLTK